MKYYFLVVYFITGSMNLLSQAVDLKQLPWKAKWITAPGNTNNQWATMGDAGLQEHGVYKFRKSFSLESVPSKFVVHVSADNRYKLYVNGQLVSLGPARGDLYYWNYESVDLSPFLVRGNNIIAALVWNDGKLKPEAQISFMTAFILQGDSANAEIINTNSSWKSVRDSSYSPIIPRVPGYYVAGPGERIDMRMHKKNWEMQIYDDTSWKPARELFNGLTKDAALDSRGWMLVPSPLPQMELKKERLATTRIVSGIQVPAGYPEKNSVITIPSNTRATLLFEMVILPMHTQH